MCQNLCAISYTHINVYEYVNGYVGAYMDTYVDVHVDGYVFEPEVVQLLHV